MPEWGMMPLPNKMLQQGVRDMVKISDSSMSGTSYGTCVLHVAPEIHVGSRRALVQEGDLIGLDVAGRRLDLLGGRSAEAAQERVDTVASAPLTRPYLALPRTCAASRRRL
jgi:dihydroxyacid dehydratase/phosphogluconate dehydratase